MKIGDVVLYRSQCTDERRTIKKIKSTATGIWITFYEDDDLLNEDIWHLAKHYEVV
jgi:hypothetical protein